MSPNRALSLWRSRASSSIPAFQAATASTLIAVAQGLAIAVVFGTVFGLLLGRSRLFERSVGHYVNGFFAMPMVVVLPLFSLWFGYSAGNAHRHHHLRPRCSPSS